VSVDDVIETDQLSKRYGSRIVAVDNVTMRVRRGEVYGFLGPNGAGKTTTLRMLLGLIRPSGGAASILGSAPGSSHSLARVGSIIETPAFYPYLSGRDNLRVLAHHAGTPLSQMDTALEEVDLAERADDKFSTYSLGMKQRLGVAAALLKDPELFILDEPTNGLDPAGMADMRELVRGLGRGKRTVVLSSHLLGEVESICDRVGIINRGRMVAEGTVDELRGSAGLRIRAEPIETAMKVLARIEGVTKIERQRDDALMVAVDPSTSARLNWRLMEAGVEVSELVRVQPSLEDVFLSLTETGGMNDDR